MRTRIISSWRRRRWIHGARVARLCDDVSETTEDHPWGHRAIKVKGKSFLFLGGEKDMKGSASRVKLPNSRDMATDLPFAEPTGYGLGKSGWVTARFAKVSDVPLDLLRRGSGKLSRHRAEETGEDALTRLDRRALSPSSSRDESRRAESRSVQRGVLRHAGEDLPLARLIRLGANHLAHAARVLIERSS